MKRKFGYIAELSSYAEIKKLQDYKRRTIDVLALVVVKEQ